jgi:hypothetical protein
MRRLKRVSEPNRTIPLRLKRCHVLFMRSVSNPLLLLETVSTKMCSSSCCNFTSQFITRCKLCSHLSHFWRVTVLYLFLSTAYPLHNNRDGLYGSASLVRTLTNLGLIDEYQILVYPVILGNGKPLWSDISHQIKLKLVNTKTHPSGVVVLFYQPVRKE